MIKQAINTALGMLIYKMIVGFFKKIIPAMLSLSAFLFGLGIDPLEKIRSLCSWMYSIAIMPFEFLSQFYADVSMSNLAQVEVSHLNDDRLLMIGIAIGFALIIFGMTPAKNTH